MISFESRAGDASRRNRRLVPVLLVCAATLGFWSTPTPARAAEESSKVEGVEVQYQAPGTPKEEWDEDRSAMDWMSRFRGRIESERRLAYRKVELAPGKYDVWVEKGKEDWFYFVIGQRADEESPRIRAQFRLYKMEKGVEAMRLDLKLVRKATKLKFSLLAGNLEGHGNLRIVEDSPPEE
ncbi:MAG: hypothetical protein KDC38_15420 [Planctomycetes bacterium]|nr:hypothetical protein [Planctomycetota bacterium]